MNPTGCVWCQRAHPDISRAKTKRNAKVRAIGDSDAGPVYHVTKIWLYCPAMLVVCCEQIVESLEQSHTQARGCVWCQRAHPGISRAQTKRNAKVRAQLMMSLTARLMILLTFCEQAAEYLK